MTAIVKNETHGYNLVEEYRHLRLVELYPIEGKRSVSRFYIVRYDANNGQVFSYLAQDQPDKSTGADMFYASGLRPASIAYVANPMTAKRAREIWERTVAKLTREFGE